MIASAVQRGAFVYIYDEKGHLLANISAKKGLISYSGNSVCVTDGHFNYIYDEKGHLIANVPAR